MSFRTPYHYSKEEYLHLYLQEIWISIASNFLPRKQFELLPCPTFVIVDTTKYWGKWCGGSIEEIHINSTLITKYNWSFLREVMAHEIAHQVVEKIFKITDQKSHGKAFIRACKILRVSPKASIKYPTLRERIEMAVKNKEPSGILAKVKKLLALATSSNIHEAEQATSKAYELIAKYNLSLVSNHNNNDCEYINFAIGKNMKVRQIYIKILVVILRDFYFIKPIWIPRLNLDGSKGVTLLVSGRPENVLIAEYVYEFVLTYINTKWQEVKKTRKKRKGIKKQGYTKAKFAQGVVQGFQAKLTLSRIKIDNLTTDNTSLITIGDQQLQKFCNYHYPNIKHESYGIKDHSTNEAYQSGHQHGKKLIIHKSINSSNNSKKLLT